MIDFFILLAAFALTLGLTVWVRKILLARALLDHPNERSSHTIPTPRGGGWALLAVLVPGMLLTSNTLKIASLGVMVLAAISWLDDRKGVHPAIRLGIHLAVAAFGYVLIAVTLLGDFGTVPSLISGILPLWLEQIMTIVGFAWFINLYNFMDGIDGITGVETISISTGVCLVMAAAGIVARDIDILTLLLTGSCLGFLALNWHPAKIFMGDVGSVPLGFLTGFMLLALALSGYSIPALILPLYYLADSGITITRRALRGEKIWQPHRQHFYQKAALAAGCHDKIVIWIALGNIALIGAALLAVTHPWAGLAGAIMIVAILLGKMHNYPVQSRNNIS